MGTQIQLGHPPIFISGFPRSGGAWLAGILASCGAFGGKWMGNALRTPFGNTMEHLVIQSHATKVCLARRGMGSHFGKIPPEEAWKRQPQLPIKELKDIVQTILFKDGYDPQRGSWLYKDARLVLCYPEWMSAFPNAYWILCYREKKRVAYALNNTGGIFSSVHEAEQWLDGYETLVYRLLSEFKTRVYVVNMDIAMGGNLKQVRDIVDAVGLTWNHYKVSQWIHNREKHK